MPHIIVTAGDPEAPEQAAVMLRERVNETDFESERFAANLLERLGWAVEDATAAERREVAEGHDMPKRGSPQPEAPEREWDPEPAGVA